MSVYEFMTTNGFVINLFNNNGYINNQECEFVIENKSNIGGFN